VIRVCRSRWRALLAVALLIAGSGYVLSTAEIASAQADERPNVLIFVTDDQRATNTMWVMPKTSRYFQRQGARYPNAFAVTPLCCPSRATIFTGRYAHNTGVRGNGPRDVRALDRTTLFPRLLQEAGYQTAIAGKFLNSWPLRTPPPYFDRWATRGLPYVDPTFNVDGDVRTVDGYSTTLVGRFASRFLRGFERDDAAPWLLYVAPNAPHYPWRPASRHRSVPVGAWSGNPAVFESDLSDKPSFVRSASFSLAEGRTVRQGQLRLLMSVDDLVGRIFGSLRTLGETRRTLAIFLSDNGYLWTEHHLGQGGGRGQKRVPYTQSVQIPLFLRWPGHVTAGSREGRITGTVDIAPTVLAAAGAEPDSTASPLDGRSLLSDERRRRIVLEYWREPRMRIPTWASYRTQRFQYIEYYEDGRTSFREYYNLIRDPWQLRNLLHDGNRANNPAAGSLSRQLRNDRQCVGTTGERACP
jgi:arylsulfatase A-like enzyme